MCLEERMMRLDIWINRTSLRPSRLRRKGPNLASFLHAFVYLRNVCAHHSRLWDKSLSIKPQLPPGKLWDPIRKSPANSIFPAASTIYWMLGHDSVASASCQAWRESLENVMTKFSKRFPSFVRFTGFPAGWQSLALWK